MGRGSGSLNIQLEEMAFPFIAVAPRSTKPRESGLTIVADRGYGVNHFFQQEVVIDVGPRQHGTQGRALGVYHNMALGALFAPIRGIRPNRFGDVLCPPFGAWGAGTRVESKLGDADGA